jgi:alpha-mannosidase
VGEATLDGAAIMLPPIEPRLELLDDPSDTWSHGIDRYADGPGTGAKWDPAVVVDKGPLMAAFVRSGSIGESRVWAETRVYGGCPEIDLILRVHWCARHKVLKFVLPFAAPAVRRVDGIPGHYLPRELDGRERPLRDWALFESGSGSQLGVVCPDVYALDAGPDRARLTLLRSPLMAHHEPRGADSLRGTVADQGVHEFRFRFLGGKAIRPAALDAQAAMLCRPPIRADVTHGMGQFPQRKAKRS